MIIFGYTDCVAERSDIETWALAKLLLQSTRHAHIYFIVNCYYRNATVLFFRNNLTVCNYNCQIFFKLVKYLIQILWYFHYRIVFNLISTNWTSTYFFKYNLSIFNYLKIIKCTIIHFKNESFFGINNHCTFNFLSCVK